MIIPTRFKAIRDCKERALYAYPTIPLKERIAEYNRQLRKCVKPVVYVRYCLTHFDKYIDTYMITEAVKHVYPDVTDEMVYGWMDKYKDEHQKLSVI